MNSATAVLNGSGQPSHGQVKATAPINPITGRSTYAPEHTQAQNTAPTREKSEKVSFDPNVPQLVALKYAQGKQVFSSIDGSESVMFSLVDGRVMFLQPWLAARIAELGVKPRETFQVTRKVTGAGPNQRTEWLVERPETVKPPEVSCSAASASSVDDTAIAQQHTPDIKLPQSPYGKLMAGAMIAAIDALLVARDYAAAKGLAALNFNEEDVRCTAASLFIQFTRENGGPSQWRQ